MLGQALDRVSSSARRRPWPRPLLGPEGFAQASSSGRTLEISASRASVGQHKRGGDSLGSFPQGR